MAATWSIGNNDAKYIEALGQAEFDRRKAIAKTKADELTDWHEQIFMAPQFESIAMQMSVTQFATAEKWDGDRWARLICKLAGV